MESGCDVGAVATLEMTTSESAVNEGSAAELSKELELLKHEEQTLLRIKEIIKRQLESLKVRPSFLYMVFSGIYDVHRLQIPHVSNM